MPQSTSPPGPPLGPGTPSRTEPYRDSSSGQGPAQGPPSAAPLHYIIRAHDDESALTALSALLAGLQSGAQVELVDTIGPAGRPHTAVVAVMPDQARALEQRVLTIPNLMIEPDRPLSLD